MNSGKTPTTQEIAVRAQQLKVLHLALGLSFASVLDPAMPVLATELRRMSLPPNGDFPVNLFDGEGGPDKECLSFSARQIFFAATSVQGNAVRDLLSISMINIAIVIADMIQGGATAAPVSNVAPYESAYAPTRTNGRQPSRRAPICGRALICSATVRIGLRAN